MSTKTISITEEAYNRLASRKEEKESFSDVINKITKKRDILEFAGLLNEEQGKELENAINESRKLSRKRYGLE